MSKRWFTLSVFCLLSTHASAQVPLPDLVTNIISVKRFSRPASAPPGGWPPFFCEVTYEIKNIGQAPAQSPKGFIASSFVVNGKAKPGQGIPFRGALAPQASATDKVLIFDNAETSCPSSTLAVEIKVDPWGDIAEASESNNGAAIAAVPTASGAYGESTSPKLDIKNVHMCSDLHHADKSVQARKEFTRPQLGADGEIVKASGSALTSLPASLWETGRTLRVRLNTNRSSALLRSKVKAAADEWAKYANIKFQFVAPPDPAEIRVSFDEGGSWSSIGRQALGVPFDFATMNFGWLTDSSSSTEIQRVVLHEFGHALGLVHEHQSPTSPIQWDKEKAYAYYKATNEWSENDVNEDVFKRYQAYETNYSKYDPLSIMHYPVDPSLTLDGVSVPWNTTLSAIDKKWIRMWYPSPADSEGVVRTNDDCDQIEFKVENGLVAADQLMVVLKFGATVSWWKAVAIPAGNGYRIAEAQDSDPLTIISITADQLDASRQIRFGKAKGGGQHVWLPFTWDALPALGGGMKLTLRWVRDRC